MASSTEESDTATDARDDIEFLTSSWNRLDVLERIADEQTTRNELRDSVSVSRVTLSRILSDLETRNWIEKQNATYEATSTGAFLAAEVSRLLDNVRTVNRLGDNVEWIQLDQFDFDLHRLADADVIMPTWDDFSAQTRTLVDMVYESSSIKGIGTGLDREFMRALADATINGDLSLELIFTPEVIEAINSEPELSRLFRDLTDVPNADIYRYDGGKPVMELGIHEPKSPDEDIVMLCGDYEEGAPPGTVKSTDRRVREWAESYFDARQSESQELMAATFTVGPSP